MKLLIKTTDELKNALGFLDADLSFDNFKTDLEHATIDIIKLLGQTTYDAIADFYHASEYTPGEDDPTQAQMHDLLVKAQSPIAMFANLAIEANTDLAHTNAGRTVKIGTDEKQPWEWQINRDNSAQYRRAFKALDVLINELDQLEYTPWLQSTAYKTSRALFIYKTDQFPRLSGDYISRQLYLRLTAFMEDAEEEHIEPVIGVPKFEELKENILDNAVPSTDTTLLKRIQKAVAFYALADAFKLLPVEMFPNGLVSYNEKGRMTSEARTETMLFFHDKAKYHMSKLEIMVSETENVNTEEENPITGMNPLDKFVNL